jgi:hypothetical protein
VKGKEVRKKVGFDVIGAIIALMMEAANTSETLVNFYQTTRRYNSEDSRHINIRSLKFTA